MLSLVCIHIKDVLDNGSMAVVEINVVEFYNQFNQDGSIFCFLTGKRYQNFQVSSNPHNKTMVLSTFTSNGWSSIGPASFRVEKVNSEFPYKLCLQVLNNNAYETYIFNFRNDNFTSMLQPNAPSSKRIRVCQLNRYLVNLKL